VTALVERVGDGLAEAVEGHDAVPLGFGLPLVVRVLPRLLRGDGQNDEIRSVAADLALLGIFPEEADELDVIEIHNLILLFLFLGHAKASGFCFQGERLLYGREPNGVRAEPGKQKTRSCRTQELARSSAQENEWQKKDNLLY
jgi:hypothetical protein